MDNKRLEAIKAKAEGMGLALFTNSGVIHITKSDGRLIPLLMDKDFWVVMAPGMEDTAESLLALRDPKAVRVEINPIHNCYHCDLFNDTNCKHLILNPVAGAPVKVPGPDCLFNKMPLGEDEEYVLVKRRKVVE